MKKKMKIEKREEKGMQEKSSNNKNKKKKKNKNKNNHDNNNNNNNKMEKGKDVENGNENKNDERRSHLTWPFPSYSSPFSSFLPSSSTPSSYSSQGPPQDTQRRRIASVDTDNYAKAHDFSTLPFDIVARIAAAFTVPNLWAMSQVCRSWRDALRPLREAMALVRWGKRFKHGHPGVRPNPDKALDSFLKAAARGSAPAMVDAGLLFWEMGDRSHAVNLYRSAAALGDASGLCNLGISHLHAEPPMLEEAAKCFHQAAVAGHVRAQYNLALCLHQGRGVKRNLEEAAKWYLKAAEGGYARAMYNTSLCYSFGEGLRCSHHQAKKWMKRAADCGHSKAQYEYGLKLFSTGEMTTALVYLELAMRGGESAAAHVKEVLLQQLSPASRNRAMQSADNWRPSRSHH